MNVLFWTTPPLVVPCVAGTAGGAQKRKNHKSSTMFLLLFSLMLNYIKVHLDKNLNTISMPKNNF